MTRLYFSCSIFALLLFQVQLCAQASKATPRKRCEKAQKKQTERITAKTPNSSLKLKLQPNTSWEPKATTRTPTTASDFTLPKDSKDYIPLSYAKRRKKYPWLFRKKKGCPY